ncbi:MAG: MFS transporter [Chloroflexi bacterium]|nr:MFS transporter [Chloroflexota bacterium]
MDSSPKLLDKRLLTILGVIFVQIVGASMVLPILPLYARRSFDMTPEVITLLITAFFAAQFIAGPYLGRLSDTYGRVPVLIISQIGTAISFVMLGLADSVEILFLARVLDGITGGNIIVAQAYVTDITPRSQRTQALGLIFAAFGVGFIIGPATGGILSAVFDIRTPFFIAAIAASALVVLTWVVLEESVSEEQRALNRQKGSGSIKPAAILQNTPLMLVLFVAFMGQFGFGLLQSTFALYGEAVLYAGQSEDAASLGIGLILAVIGLGQLITQMVFLKPLVDRFGEARLITGGSALRGLTLFVYALITSPLIAAANGFIFAIGTGVMIPSSQSLATDTVDDELRGGVLGIYNSARSLAIIFGTAIGGTLFAIDATTPYWVGGVLFMLAVLSSIPLLRWKDAEAQSAVVVGK